MSSGNEPAYPHTFTISSSEGDATVICNGITKRELIAAMAMQGYLASFAGISNGNMKPDAIADESVKYADALLEALNGKS